MLKESDTGGHHGLATLSFSDNHTEPPAFTPSWKADAGEVKTTKLCHFFSKNGLALARRFNSFIKFLLPEILRP
ncbi:hypothetical protein ACLBW0_05235 [Enterobacteriaceae bacterium C34A]